MNVLITGWCGSIGSALYRELETEGHSVWGYDVADEPADDVRDFIRLERTVKELEPEVIFHLAGAKHAGSGEIDPEETVDINVNGTANVLIAARKGTRVVTASTCKAADPETVYGATKLIAERLTLNADQAVARFYNVRETSGNVFEIWRNTPVSKPLPVTNCRRYFITVADAVRLMRSCAILPPGLYTVDPGPIRWMPDEAASYGRATTPIEPRRGDRLCEPRKAHCERLTPIADGIEQIVGPYDQTWSR